MKMKFFFSLLLASLSCLVLHAQTLVVNGEIVSQTVLKITFADDAVVLHFDDGTTMEYDMEAVKLTFGTSSGIEKPVVGRLCQMVNGQIVLEGLAENTRISIFDAKGHQHVSTTSQQIDVSHLPAGVYLLKAGGHLVKFIKN